MKSRKITEDFWELSPGIAKTYLIHCKGVLTLIDTGLPGWAEQILSQIDILGLGRDNLKHILITHFHNDHTGSLLELKELTGAKIYAHKREVESLKTVQNVVSGPGVKNKLIFNLFIKGAREGSPRRFPVDEQFDGGEVLNFAGGLQVVETPGHSPGHTSYLYPGKGGILIVGDAATGGRKPSYPVLFTDETEAMKTLAMIGSLDFETACFSHGRNIEREAPLKFREAFHRQVL